MHQSRVRLSLSQPLELNFQHLVPDRQHHHARQSTVTLRTIIPTFQVVGCSLVQFPNALLQSQKHGRTRSSISIWRVSVDASHFRHSTVYFYSYIPRVHLDGNYILPVCRSLSLLSRSHSITTARVEAIKMHSSFRIVDGSMESRWHHDSRWMLRMFVTVLCIFIATRVTNFCKRGG
jgi:hypothetical protein